MEMDILDMDMEDLAMEDLAVDMINHLGNPVEVSPVRRRRNGNERGNDMDADALRQGIRQPNEGLAEEGHGANNGAGLHGMEGLAEEGHNANNGAGLFLSAEEMERKAVVVRRERERLAAEARREGRISIIPQIDVRESFDRETWANEAFAIGRHLENEEDPMPELDFGPPTTFKSKVVEKLRNIFKELRFVPGPVYLVNFHDILSQSIRTSDVLVKEFIKLMKLVQEMRLNHYANTTHWNNLKFFLKQKHPDIKMRHFDKLRSRSKINDGTRRTKPDMLERFVIITQLYKELKFNMVWSLEKEE